MIMAIVMSNYENDEQYNRSSVLTLPFFLGFDLDPVGERSIDALDTTADGAPLALCRIFGDVHGDKIDRKKN